MGVRREGRMYAWYLGKGRSLLAPISDSRQVLALEEADSSCHGGLDSGLDSHRLHTKVFRNHGRVVFELERAVQVEEWTPHHLLAGAIIVAGHDAGHTLTALVFQLQASDVRNIFHKIGDCFTLDDHLVTSATVVRGDVMRTPHTS